MTRTSARARFFAICDGEILLLAERSDGWSKGFAMTAGNVEPTTASRILVVGNGPAAQQFEELVCGLGYSCKRASVDTAIELALAYRPEIIVPELVTTAADAVAWQIRCELRKPIFVAAIAESRAQRAIGVHARLVAPFDRDEIQAMIGRATAALAAN